MTLVLIIGILLTTQQETFTFDVNFVYPGEGSNGAKVNWSAREPALSMTTWNVKSLTFERFFYCQSLKYDVFVIRELWRTTHKFVLMGPSGELISKRN